MNRINQHFEEALMALKAFTADKTNFQRIEEAGKIMVQSLQNGGTLFSCGNGGSMADAMHFAEELTGRYRDDREPIAAVAISDPTYLTCVGNDYGFDEIFSRFIAAHGKTGDVLLAISTSGNSKNVLKAIEAAQKKGMRVVGLTGKTGGKMAQRVNVEIRAPESQFADRAQEIHIKVIHSLIDYIEQN